MTMKTRGATQTNTEAVPEPVVHQDIKSAIAGAEVEVEEQLQAVVPTPAPTTTPAPAPTPVPLPAEPASESASEFAPAPAPAPAPMASPEPAAAPAPETAPASATPASVIPAPPSASTPTRVPSAPAVSPAPVLIPPGGVPPAQTTFDLMVNFIPQSVDEARLRSLFAECGEIASCKLISDKLTGRHKAFGFVNFYTHEAAKAAITKFNGFELDGKWLKVVFARQSADGTKRASVYVTGLPITFTEDDVAKLFEPYGPIIDINVLMTIDGESKGNAFVMHSCYTNASKAIAELNNTVPAGASSRISLKMAEGAPATGEIEGVPSSAQGGGYYQGYCLFTFNLPPEYNEADLKALHAPYGDVTDVKLMRDSYTQESRGFGFVNLPTLEQAKASIGALNGSTLQGRVLKVDFKKPKVHHPPKPHFMPQQGGYPPIQAGGYPPAPYQQHPTPYGQAAGYPPAPYPPQQPAPYQQATGYQTPQPYGPMRHQRGYERPNPMAAGANDVPPPPQQDGDPAYQGYCLFNFNLPPDFDETMLKAMYAPYGNATAVTVMRDSETKQSRGFGFVNLPSLQQAQAAIAALNGSNIQGRELKVSFKKPSGRRPPFDPSRGGASPMQQQPQQQAYQQTPPPHQQPYGGGSGYGPRGGQYGPVQGSTPNRYQQQPPPQGMYGAHSQQHQPQQQPPQQHQPQQQPQQHRGAAGSYHNVPPPPPAQQAPAPQAQGYGAVTAEDAAAAYQRALQHFQQVQASGGESQAAYNDMMSKYKVYQALYEQQGQCS